MCAFRHAPMASNHSASIDHISTSKQREFRYLTIAEKMEILHMKKEGESSSAIARHFGVSRTTILETMKAEDRIRKTADSTFNMSSKKLISRYFKPLFLMETALVTWIEDCRQKIIQIKAKSIYETFTSKETDNIQDGDENPINDSQPANLSILKPKIRFSASRKWFYKFLKRYGLGSVLLPGNAASNKRICNKNPHEDK